jgi:hypothetical protein
MAKKLSGWFRMFIVFAGVWTTIAIIVIVIAVATGEWPYPFFYLIWLIPIGLVYIFGRCVGWIIRGFRKDKE